jgi:hypothetical protein
MARRETFRRFEDEEWIMPRNFPGGTLLDLRNTISKWGAFLAVWPNINECSLRFNIADGWVAAVK